MIVGYNAPLKFAYWSEGLSPLFTETTLGSLPHQVRHGQLAYNKSSRICCCWLAVSNLDSY